MEKFLSLRKAIKLPAKNEIRSAINSFSVWQRAVFSLLFIIFTVSALSLLFKVNNAFLVETPTQGGEIKEGVIGTPRFINPVLSTSDTDRDLSALVYSGLMRKTPGGSVIADLAESFEQSRDGLIYTFKLKEDIQFHDGENISADDIVFTINKIQDPYIKSPKKLNWEGISVEKIDDRTVKFTLKQPFVSFLENATVGILPAHLWRDIKVDEFSFIEQNTRGVGSGPYKIKKISKKSSGIPEYYQLEAFNKFALGKPYIKKFVMRFYQNERDLVDALRRGEIDQISAIGPEIALSLEEKGYRTLTAVLPRIFGLFFNQNQNKIFADKKAVEALELSIDKDEIVQKVLYGYGQAIDSPIPQNLDLEASLPKEAKLPSPLEQAKQILADDGWTPGEDGILEKTTKNKGKSETIRLAFSISTGDTTELKQTAELLQAQLERIGARVEIKVFEIGSLNQDVIRARKYDALLFGQIVAHESDLFAFWHSSQRNDPGLNIAMYTNAKTDKILEATPLNYADFKAEIKKDKPAIFLYSPEFIYIVAKNLNGLIINKITSPADRFLQAYEWYRENDRVWKIFTK